MKKEYRLQFLLFITAIILTALISLKIYFRIDMTKEKKYTLSVYTKEFLNELNSTIEVTWFKSRNADSFFPSLKYLADMLLEYKIHAAGKFAVTEKNVETISEGAINKLGLIPRQIETQNNSASTLFTIYSGLMIEYKGETRLIPFIDDIDILEYDIARFISDIESVLQKKIYEKTVAVIAPPNSLEAEYSYVKAWLEYAGFVIVPITLPIENISPELPLLVLGSDYIDVSSAAAIDVFLQKEGKAVFFVSGNKIDVKGNWKATPKIKDFVLSVLASYGFYINSDLILDLFNFRITMSGAANTGIKMINYPFWIQIQNNNIEKNNPIFSGYKSLQTFWPSSIFIDTDKNKNLKKLAAASVNAVKMIESYNTDPFGNQLKLLADGEKASYTLIAGYEKPSRVLVISDEYMISNAIDYTGSSYNLDFLINCLEYVTGKDDLIFLKNKKHTAEPFKQFDNNAEFNSIVFRARFFSFLVLPLFILGVWVYIFIAQRKQK